jgi:hypothetical protein
MQPFMPWVWRDPAFATSYAGAEEERDDEAPDSALADRERAGVDLAGYDVEATDGKVGAVDEASHEAGASLLVVDTGPWIFGRKVLLPAGTVDRIDHADRKVYVDRTKEQIKNSPEYDPDTFRKPEYREQVAAYYEESYRSTSPLL